MIAHDRIVHVTTPEAWGRRSDAPAYEADSLRSQGYVHACRPARLREVLGRHFAGHRALLLLVIDPARLTADVREEEASPGERYPHVYGPIDRAAVVDVLPIEADARGIFILPDGLGAC